MATLYPHEKKNKLELYLNDIYEKECEFQIEKEEIEFIQTGIETLVQDLVDKILADDPIDNLISYFIDEHPSLVEKTYHEKPIAEVYFPIQSDSSFQRYIAENGSQVKICKSSIIKVGSFYDGTKNNFPDEFDFILPLLGIRAPLDLPYQDIVDFLDIGKTIFKHAKQMRYTSPSKKLKVTRELKLDKYIATHGPAFKLRFIYSNGFGEQRHIRADLVPATRLIDSKSQQWFVDKVRNYVEPKTFCEEILAAGSSFIVRDNLAFTEIEQHFMKNVLSKKHMKVYRILKFLLNGHDGEKLEELLGDSPYYTSYRIKVLIIYHHEACTNTDSENLGHCVLQVLEEMSKYEKAEDFPKFTGSSEYFPFVVLPYLKSTITTLRSMQTSEGSYCYERDKIKSVSEQYLVFRSTRDQQEFTKTRQFCTLL